MINLNLLKIYFRGTCWVDACILASRPSHPPRQASGRGGRPKARATGPIKILAGLGASLPTRPEGRLGSVVGSPVPQPPLAARARRAQTGTQKGNLLGSRVGAAGPGTPVPAQERLDVLAPRAIGSAASTAEQLKQAFAAAGLCHGYATVMPGLCPVGSGKRVF